MRKIILFLSLISGASGFGQVKRAEEVKINPKVKEVIVVFKTHFDIGYTHRVKDVVHYYRTEMIDKALDIMDKTKDLPKDQQFSWAAPAWVMAKVLEEWPGQTPERKQRLEEAFRSGRFVTHAMPFSVQSQVLQPEDIARSYESASFVSRKYGLPLPYAAKMTDVPSQASVLATGLANGGIKFMHLGPNWPSGYVKYPPLFWWQGPDGSRVLTISSPAYGTTTGLTYPEIWGGSDPYMGKNLIPPTDWPYSIWPAIFVTPDNSGPPSADAVKALFDEARKFMPGVKVRVGRMEDFADAILATNPKLPVIKTEAPDTWIHGNMSDPGGMKISRNIDPLVPALEGLNTQLKNWNVKVGDITKDISTAYENILLYAEHTWGGAASVDKYGDEFKKLSPESYKDLEGSWEDKTEYIHKAENIIHPLLESNLKALADNVRQEGKRFVVYNSLPYSRSEWVKAGEGYIHAQNVPASGYKTFTEKDVVATNSATSESTVLENKYFRIAFDPSRGRIVSFIDKRSGKDWADGNGEAGLGQYMNERFTYEQTAKYVTDYQQGRAMNVYGATGVWKHPGMHKSGMVSETKVPYRAAFSKKGVLKITQEDHEQVAVMEMPADTANHMPATSLRVVLQSEAPFVDMEITIKDKQKDNWPEADWFCFPFKVNAPKFTVGRSLGMMDPATDIQEGADKDIYAAGTGVTITDQDGSGIAFYPFDHSLVSLDRPGIWKFSLDFVPKKPVIYLNLYNNQWNTNYRYWYSGTWSSKVRLWTFAKGSTTELRLITPSFEARTPLLVAAADGKTGDLPLERSGLSVSRKGIQVTAYRQDSPDNPVRASGQTDANATLLRVWEQGGQSGNVTVSFPKGETYTAAIPVNLRGEITGKAIAVKGGQLSFPLGAYAPASFILNK